MALGWNNLLTSSVDERCVASAASVRLDCARLCHEDNLGRGLAPLRLPRLRRKELRDDDFHDQHEREGVERGVRKRQVDRVERLREHERRVQQLRHEVLVVAEHERKRAHRVRCIAEKFSRCSNAVGRGRGRAGRRRAVGCATLQMCRYEVARLGRSDLLRR